MNSLLKKILSYVGVACIGAVVGISVLVGVSSCHDNNSNDVKQASAVNDIDSDNVYDFLWTFKSDLSVYYEEISFDSEDSLFFKNHYYSQLTEGWHHNVIFFIQNSMMFYDWDIPSVYNTMRFQMDIYKGATSDLDRYYLRSVKIQANVGRDSYYNASLYPNITIYDNNTLIRHLNFRISNIFDDIWYGKGNVDHVVINFIDGLYDGFFKFLNHYFVTCFDFSNKIDFTFLQDFNYNAFIQYNNDTTPLSYLTMRDKYPFTNSGSVDSSVANDVQFSTTFPMGLFVSNGVIFDYIKVYINLATTDLYFESPTGYLQTKLIDNHNPYHFVSKIYYGYTDGDYEVEVCARNVYLNEEKHSVIPYDMVWVNNEYRYLVFDETISRYNKDLLSMTSNNVFNYSGFTGNNTDVGLGNVFTLIGHAFACLVPILSISIVPGITIGLLLFLPLISGIIILIIWIVKR